MVDKADLYKDNRQTGSLLDDMDTTNKNLQSIGVELLPVHTGGVVHAKRMGGLFRRAKNLIMLSWLAFFLFPYIQWNGQQAILFDLAERKFSIFGITILPQDIWVLSLILLFFALALAAVTAIAGRAWCGYACFQTVWQDAFTWLEEKFEGLPNKRIKLDNEPWSLKKIRVKLPKWLAWGFIGFMTGFSFVAYFVPAFDLWYRLFHFQWSVTETSIILILGGFTIFFAGVLREQTCMGFCPYSRIQGAMIDTETIVPTYDIERGEPRGRLKRAKPGEKPSELGDCIDCNLCVVVCPTGVDIRKGQQFGCITCGLCIDACDSVMVKLKKPKGLIRYASIAEFAGKPFVSFFKRPRVIVYTSIMFVAAATIIWGLLSMAPIDVKVIQERAPLFVMMSDGTVQNKFYVKVVNKTDKELELSVVVTGQEGLTYVVDRVMFVEAASKGSAQLLVRIPRKLITSHILPIKIRVEDVNNPLIYQEYSSNFLSKKKR